MDFRISPRGGSGGLCNPLLLFGVKCDRIVG